LTISLNRVVRYQKTSVLLGFSGGVLRETDERMLGALALAGAEALSALNASLLRHPDVPSEDK
jgi:hypothetical protein